MSVSGGGGGTVDVCAQFVTDDFSQADMCAGESAAHARTDLRRDRSARLGVNCGQEKWCLTVVGRTARWSDLPHYYRSSDLKKRQVIGLLSAARMDEHGNIAALVVQRGRVHVENVFFGEGRTAGELDALIDSLERFETVAACQKNWDENPGPKEDAVLFRGCWVPMSVPEGERVKYYQNWRVQQIAKPGTLSNLGLIEAADPLPKHLNDENLADCEIIPADCKRYILEHLQHKRHWQLSIETLDAALKITRYGEGGAVVQRLVRVITVSTSKGLVMQGIDRLLFVDLTNVPLRINDELRCRNARTLRQLHYWVGTRSSVKTLYAILASKLEERCTVDSIIFFRNEVGAWQCLVLDTHASNGPLINSIAELAGKSAADSLALQLFGLYLSSREEEQEEKDEREEENEQEEEEDEPEKEVEHEEEEKSEKEEQSENEDEQDEGTETETDTEVDTEEEKLKETPEKEPEKKLREESEEEEELVIKKPVKKKKKRSSESEEESESEKSDVRVNEFENLDLSQIVCNVGKGQPETKLVVRSKCTTLGYAMAKNFIRVAASKIFRDPLQSIMELISNAIDSYKVASQASIGRFGMGFYSVLALPLNNNKRYILIDSCVRGEQARSLEITANDNNLFVTLKEIEDEDELITQGTEVSIETTPDSKFTEKELRKIKNYVERFSLVQGFDISRTASPENSAEKSAEAGKDLQPIRVTYSDLFVRIRDWGVGMDFKGLMHLLTPAISTKGLVIKAAPSSELLERETGDTEIGFMGKLEKQHSLEFCVNRVLVKQLFVPSVKKFGNRNIIFLPPNTPLPVDRSNVMYTDAPTLKRVKNGLQQLVKHNIDAMSVIKLQELVRKYVLDSKQVEAFALSTYLDECIANSGVLLVPQDDEMITVLCAHLDMKVVPSMTFKCSEIERGILAEMKRQGKKGNTTTFKDRIVVSIKDLHTNYLVSPLCSQLLVMQNVRDKATKTSMELLPALSCYQTTDDLDETPDLIAHFKFTPKIQSLVDSTWYIFENDFQSKTDRNTERMVYSFFRLWQMIKMDETEFEETLSIFRSKISQTFFSAAGYGRDDDDVLVTHGTGLIISSDERWYSGAFIYEIDVSMLHPALELDLLQFKLSMMPNQMKSQDKVVIFSSDTDSGWYEIVSFSDISHILLNSRYDMEEVKLIMTKVRNTAHHVVEAFVICFLFASFIIKFRVKMREETRSKCIDYIFAELRKNVARDQLLRLYAQSQSPQRQSQVALFHAKVIKPVERCFRVLEAALRGARQFLLLSESQAELREEGQADEDDEEVAKMMQNERVMTYLKTPLKAAHSLKFTVNQLIKFVYTNDELADKDSFNKIATLEKLKSSSRIHKTQMQAVAIAANFGTTKGPESILTELFQNSLDAIVSTGKSDTATILVSLNLSRLSLFDPCGVQPDRLWHLLVPFLSQKIEQKGAAVLTGEMGTGFYRVFNAQVCDHVEIVTQFGRHFTKIIATPILKGDIIFDIDVDYSFEQREDDKFGTIMSVIFKPDADRASIAMQMYLECMTKFCFSPVPLYINREHVNRNLNPQPLQVIKDGRGETIITVYGVRNLYKSELSVVSTGGVPFASLIDFWAMYKPNAPIMTTDNPRFEYEESLTPYFSVGFNIDIHPSVVQPMQNRTILSFGARGHEVWSYVRAAQLHALFAWYIGDDPTKGVSFDDEFMPHTRARGRAKQVCTQHRLTDEQVESWTEDGLVQYVRDVDAARDWVVSKLNDVKTPESESEAARKITDRMHVGELVKSVLKKWFASKTEPCQPMVVDKTGALVAQIDVKQHLKGAKKSPVLQCFADAFVASFNEALESGSIIITSQDGTEKISTQDRQVTALHIDLKAYKMGGFHINGKVVYDSRLHEETKEFFRAFRRLFKVQIHSKSGKPQFDKVALTGKKLDEAKLAFGKLATAKDTIYFTNGNDGSVLIHELLHMYVGTEHSFHPEFQVTVDGKKAQRTFNDLVLLVSTAVIGKNITDRFFDLLQSFLFSEDDEDRKARKELIPQKVR